MKSKAGVEYKIGRPPEQRVRLRLLRAALDRVAGAVIDAGEEEARALLAMGWAEPVDGDDGDAPGGP